MPPPRIEKILLPQMTILRSQLKGQSRLVIDDKGNSGGACNRQDFPGQLPDLFLRMVFGPQLNNISTAIGQLPGNLASRPSCKIGGVHKCV
jgi:hypothetical protein